MYYPVFFLQAKEIEPAPSSPCLVENSMKSAALRSGSFFNHEREFSCLKDSWYESAQIAVWVRTEWRTGLQMTGAEQAAEASHVRSNLEKQRSRIWGGKHGQLMRIRCSADRSAGPDLWVRGITSINRPHKQTRLDFIQYFHPIEDSESFPKECSGYW